MATGNDIRKKKCNVTSGTAKGVRDIPRAPGGEALWKRST